MRDITVAITAASYSGNKGAAAMLQSSINQLYERYGHRLNVNLMSVYPKEDKEQLPYDFIKVVSCKPEQLMFIAFPLAILYRVFSWCFPIKSILAKNKIIRAYRQTDLVIDEAGISFVDSRGFVMNTYAFVCAAVPLLVGTPVVKYSQAMGTFKSGWNRFLAKWILPKLKLIIARGQGTLDNLKGIGIVDNVKLCADGAFAMKDSLRWNAEVDRICKEDSFYQDNVVGLSISSVVQKKCKKLKLDYIQIMCEFVRYLTDEGYHVLLLANAARINSEKSRNNDLLVGDAIYGALVNRENVRWYHKEMDAEEIRAYIAKCRVLVASRFHAMIGALEKQVPVLLVGWSHKYQEVLDMFELGQYAIDFSMLNSELMKEEFEKFMKAESDIRVRLAKNYEAVMISSQKNMQYISEIIEQVVEGRGKRHTNAMFNMDCPDQYLGSYIACRKGYATDETIRANAASGGMVTALLCYFLQTGKIDGALVSKCIVRDGELGYQTYLATTVEELKDASSSIYMNIPVLRHINLIKEFRGKVAVVLTPCQMHALCLMLERDETLKSKIVLKCGLYCSGNFPAQATLLPLEKMGITLEGARRLYYRRGQWRGQASVVYEDESERQFSYAKSICAYKNAYFFENESCAVCQDHYAGDADISFGDVWLKEMKKEPVKYTSCVIRNEKIMAWYEEAVSSGVLRESHMSAREMVYSQKRALAFKFLCADAKDAYYKKKGKNIQLVIDGKSKWNHKMAFALARFNKEYSEKHYDQLRKIPMQVIYYYMCFIRVLLSF